MDSGKIVPQVPDGESNVPVLSRPEPKMVELPWRGMGDTYLDGGAAQTQSTLREYWAVLLKRRWVVVATVVTILVLAGFATLRATRLYEASATIAVFREANDVLGFKDMKTASAEDWDPNIALDTQVKIVESETLALKVIQKLQLHKNAKFMRTTPEAMQAAGEMDETAALGYYQMGLRVNSLPKTRLVQISFLSPDPRVSADIVNTLVNVYIEQNFTTKFDSTMQASEWLSKQLQDLQLKVEDSQEKFVRYQRENQIIGTDEKTNITMAKLDELNRELMAAEADRIQKEARYRHAIGNNVAEAVRFENNNLLEKLRSRKSELDTQLAQLTTQFGPSYPKVAETRNQIKQLDEAVQLELGGMLQRLKSEFQTAQQREGMLRRSFESQKQQANLLNEKSIQYSILKREADSNRELYQNLLQRMKEASVSASMRSGNIRIVDSARAPMDPSKPNVRRNMMLALLIGLAGGIGLAFLIESLDNTVTTAEEAQMLSGLPALATIPLSDSQHAPRKSLLPKIVSKQQAITPVTARANQPLVTVQRPRSASSEAYRALRTSILLSNTGAPPKVTVVTSALPQEGKSTTSMNLAVVLAQGGARVLLVDADMRRPTIHTRLQLRSRGGLSTLLTGGDTIEQVLLPSGQHENLFIIPAGPPPPHPSELLSSIIMRKQLEQWRMQFDHVVIDTPPCLSVTDAVLMSAMCDSVVLVVRSGQTPRAAVRRARELLGTVNSRALGIVLNAFDVSASYYGYGYGSRYYGKGYGHYFDESTTKSN